MPKFHTNTRLYNATNSFSIQLQILSRNSNYFQFNSKFSKLTIFLYFCNKTFFSLESSIFSIPKVKLTICNKSHPKLEQLFHMQYNVIFFYGFEQQKKCVKFFQTVKHSPFDGDIQIAVCVFNSIKLLL